MSPLKISILLLLGCTLILAQNPDEPQSEAGSPAESQPDEPPKKEVNWEKMRKAAEDVRNFWTSTTGKMAEILETIQKENGEISPEKAEEMKRAGAEIAQRNAEIVALAIERNQKLIESAENVKEAEAKALEDLTITVNKTRENWAQFHEMISKVYESQAPAQAPAASSPEDEAAAPAESAPAA